MASPRVEQAVSDRLAAWTHALIVGPNLQGSVPADGSPFLEVSFPVSSEDQITLGAPGACLFREYGAIRFVLSIPIGKGLSPWNGWIEELRPLFRAAQFGGVCTWAPAPTATNDDDDDGAYFKLSFAVPYYFDFLA